MARRLYQLQEHVISWHWVRDFWKEWWSRPFLTSMWSQTSSIGITYEFAWNAGFQAQIPCPLPSYWIRTCVLLRSPDDSCEQLWFSLCPTELSQLLGSLWPISFFAVLGLERSRKSWEGDEVGRGGKREQDLTFWDSSSPSVKWEVKIPTLLRAVVQVMNKIM